jgi:hypothetical protein
LYLNGQIHIQMIKFKFKRTNQELTVHYRPSAPVAGGSVDDTTRSGSSADGTVRSRRALPLPPDPTATSSGGTVPPSGRALSPATEPSLTKACPKGLIQVESTKHQELRKQQMQIKKSTTLKRPIGNRLAIILSTS